MANPIQGVFLPHAQCSSDKLQRHQNTNQYKEITEDERMI